MDGVNEHTGPDAASSPDDYQETRSQRGGEAGTTRFGMEDGDDTEVPSTGVDPDQQSDPPPTGGRAPKHNDR